MNSFSSVPKHHRRVALAFAAGLALSICLGRLAAADYLPSLGVPQVMWRETPRPDPAALKQLPPLLILAEDCPTATLPATNAPPVQNQLPAVKEETGLPESPFGLAPGGTPSPDPQLISPTELNELLHQPADSNATPSMAPRFQPPNSWMPSSTATYRKGDR